MSDDGLKLTVYFGERDRADGGFLADALIGVAERHRLRASLVLRGIEGFGLRQRLRTDRLLTLSEDLPLVAVAVDRPPAIEAALADVRALRVHGLVTLERARLLGTRSAVVDVPWAADAATKVTFYVGRRERLAGRPAAEAIVAHLHARGIAGATVLLGVDGTAHGVRQRARFLGRNGAVPLMVIAVGDSDRIAAVLPELTGTLARPLVTLERVRICKRDGTLLGAPGAVAARDPSGLAVWQKLMIYSGEQAQAGGEPLHQRLVRELRAAGAAGVTCLRGVWGYHGDHAPHGDTFWQLRRRVPVVTVLADTPERIARWFPIVDRLTARTGLVTSELVPAFHATAPGAEEGGLRLAEGL